MITTMHKCPECGGDGRYRDAVVVDGDPRDPNCKIENMMVECETCHGAGELSSDEMYECLETELKAIEKERRKHQRWYDEACEELSRIQYLKNDYEEKIMRFDSEIADVKRKMDLFEEE